MKIPIFTDDAGWHGARLKEAFAIRGVDAVFLSLQECVINLSGTSPTIQIPGFDVLPPAVFVRGIAGGTMQQVITRLNVLHMLSILHVKIYNDVKAIERTVDKAMTSFLLKKNGISTPPTWVAESRSQVANIRQIAAQNNQTLVLKPLFGSQGLGVRKLLAKESLPVPMQQFVDGVYYLQQLIETPMIDGNVAPHDYRVFVIGGRVVAAMKRVGNTWVNNVAAGGRCEKVAENEQLSTLALQAASALDIDYCGVDIIQAASGQYYVLEVNSIPAWKGLQSVAEINIAQLLVDDCLSKIGERIN
ncbi:MAG: RimK family alpha-L-glutamate ligase [Methylotenera sp.]|nr:RimK family alpha-L-glutamate ligase [Methylotenera sp.]